MDLSSIIFMSVSKKIGQNLQVIINQWFISQINFAKYFRVSRQTVSNWCAGDVLTPFYVLLFLEEKTGITMREMSREDITPKQVDFDNPFKVDKSHLTDLPNIIYLKDATVKYQSSYQKATLVLPSPSEPSSDDPATLRERIAILETTNLYRAGKIEELEARLGMVEARVKQLENKGETIDK